MTKWSILWLLWASAGIIIEFAALLSHQKGATLSEHIWSMRGNGIYSLILMFLGWMIYHFLFEGRG